VRVFEQAVTYPGVKFEIVFGVSDSNWKLYDLASALKKTDPLTTKGTGPIKCAEKVRAVEGNYLLEHPSRC
jgi:hypothetical protein